MTPEELFPDVRAILLRDWDPIGVTAFEDYDEATETEYDGLAMALSRMLAEGASRDDLQARLRAFEEDDLGLDYRMDEAVRAADLLAGLA
jgi:hypothetical protein